MRNLRVLIIALVVLSTALFPMPAKSLPSQGGCDKECRSYDLPDGPFSICVAGSSMASCTAIVRCPERGIDCYATCDGGLCLWV